MNYKEWNYSRIAHHYDFRAPYPYEFINSVLIRLKQDNQIRTVCDVGAGTGNLTEILGRLGFCVDAVELSQKMLDIGKLKTEIYKNINWIKTDYVEYSNKCSKYDLLTFGSSFNIIYEYSGLMPILKSLRKNGYIFIIFNYRDLDSPIQILNNNILKKFLHKYESGIRTQDFKKLLSNSKAFNEIKFIKYRFSFVVNVNDYINGLKSHMTLIHQLNDKFKPFLNELKIRLIETFGDEINIPFTSKIWTAKKIQ